MPKVIICWAKRGRYSAPIKLKSSSIRKYMCDNVNNNFLHPRKVWWCEKDMYTFKNGS